MARCERRGCPNEAKPKGRFCSSTCRAQDWRERHTPRCPHCGKAVVVTVADGSV